MPVETNKKLKGYTVMLHTFSELHFQRYSQHKILNVRVSTQGGQRSNQGHNKILYKYTPPPPHPTPPPTPPPFMSLLSVSCLHLTVPEI